MQPVVKELVLGSKELPTSPNEAGGVAGSAQLIPMPSRVGEDLAPEKPGRIVAHSASATSWNYRSRLFKSQLLIYLQLEPPEKCHFAGRTGGDTTSAPAVCAQTICRGKKTHWCHLPQASHPG